jgi:hypothetical protein
VTDETIIRMAEEASQALSEVDGHIQCNYLMPSYNAMLQAAKANHPNDPFLSALIPLELISDRKFYVSGAELRVLLGQLRIALESLHEPPQR